MSGEDAFRVESVVIEALPNRTYRVELANGYRLLGFLAGRTKQTVTNIVAGDRVRLQLTPYDLSSGRILVETK